MHVRVYIHMTVEMHMHKCCPPPHGPYSSVRLKWIVRGEMQQTNAMLKHTEIYEA